MLLYKMFMQLALVVMESKIKFWANGLSSLLLSILKDVT
jgi:hypothetical protein